MPKTPTKLSSLIKARYQVRDNTFIRAAKDDPRDRVDIEIGDEKQPSTFYPQVKIKRWDNECNFSCRLKDNDYDTPTIQTSQDKIKWISGKREAHFYEIGASQDHPGGAYEFEVVLKERPASNVVEFSIQTKGLEFLYQPALTPEEIEQGAFRPENVIGSYAVYYKDCPANYEGGKLYRTGKAFHIYRPKIEDAKGNWTWGELRVDEKQGTLAVTIPWEFLDEAVYPVMVDPTFGYTTVGGTNFTPDADNHLNGSKFTSPSDTGTATSISLYTGDAGNFYSGNMKGVIVKESDLNIVTNAITPRISCAKEFAWRTGTFASSPTLSPSTSYILGFVNEGTNLEVKYDSDANLIRFVDTSNSYSSPSNPTDGSFNNYQKFSIYCTYTASASSKIKKFMGIEQAKLKKISGIAIASVKKLVGVANT